AVPAPPAAAPLAAFLAQMEWRPPRVSPGPPAPPRPKIRPTQKRAAPSDLAGDEAEAKRPNQGDEAVEEALSPWEEELRDFLQELDRGKGVMLQYHKALAEYGGFKPLLDLVADEGKHTDLLEAIDIQTEGHWLLLKRGLSKMSSPLE
ncbi:unnamed protein product, partial [Durusdinium trenchii]